MTQLLKCLVITLLFAFISPASAVQIEFHNFKNAQQERLYLALIAELRCVKCQNQNLAESNAELAKDMRDKTYSMVISGKSREDVVNYMTARYGDFVLYRPPLKGKTLLLWAGPPILFFLSIFFLIKYIRKQNKQEAENISDAERESVRDLLKSNSSGEK